MRGRWVYALSALVTGALLGIAWPAIGGATPLIFIAWVPLLLAEERFATSDRSRRPRSFMLYVLLALAVWNALTTWWLFCVREDLSTRLFTVIGPNIGNDVLMCIPWWIMRATRRTFGARAHAGRWARLALVIAWTGFERFHMHWDLSWPWLTLGNVFAEHTQWVQWYEITGHLGGTLWVWGVNMLAFRWVMQRHGGGAVAVAAAVLVPWGLSQWRYASFQQKGDPVEVVVVQPNIDPYTDKFNGDPLRQLDDMLAMAGTACTDRTALVVLPETALQEQPRLENDGSRLLFHGLWENDLEGSQSVQRIRAFLARHKGLSVIAGMSSAYLYPEGAALPVTARLDPALHRGFDAYNAALLVRPDGSVEPYHKSKLVPGAELLPFESVLGPLAGAVALDLGGTTGSLGVQEEREVMSTDRLHIAPVICYESIYGDHVAAHVRNGATLITIMTNDAWWDDTPGYRQHLAYGRLRAVETRRAVARSANTGISCFIDQRGDLHEVTDWWTRDVRKDVLLARSDLTLYVRWGDWIGIPCEALAGAWLLVLLARWLRRLTRR